MWRCQKPVFVQAVNYTYAPHVPREVRKVMRAVNNVVEAVPHERT